jgi:hypothetical protein
MGNVLHAYIEHYWWGIREGKPTDDAHLSSKILTSTKYMPELKVQAEQAFQLGSPDLAAEIEETLPRAGRIIDRYYNIRGKDDGERYEPLLIEQDLKVIIYPGILSNGKVDCVTRDRADGIVHLWENKSTRTIPTDEFRFRDVQTVLYDQKLKAANFQYSIDHIMWNYLRTREPEVPEVVYKGTKREGLSRAKTLDTTWEVFAAAIAANKYDPRAYSDMHALLEFKEETAYFPRYDIPIVVDKEFLMSQYIATSERMRQKKDEWLGGFSTPIMHLQWSCDRCDMYRLCQAKLVGGDQDDLIKMFYDIGRGGF